MKIKYNGRLISLGEYTKLVKPVKVETNANSRFTYYPDVMIAEAKK